MVLCTTIFPRNFVGLAVLVGIVAAHQPSAIRKINYDEEKARVYFQYARVSFCARPAIERWNCGDMCDAAPVISNRIRYIPPGPKCQVQGYVAQAPDPDAGSLRRMCVVSFRGSVNIWNFVADGKFAKINWPNFDVINGFKGCPNCQVHEGFAEAYTELRFGMLKAVRDLECTKVVAVGVSLGAAIATLASMELRAFHNISTELWAYAQPRVGDIEFVKAFVAAAQTQGVDPPAWRITHYHDMVPSVPPHGRIWKYTHEPLEVFYTTENSDAFKVCEWTEGQFENPQCHRSVRTWQLNVKDHLNYFNLTTDYFKLPETCVPPSAKASAQEDIAVTSLDSSPLLSTIYT